MKEKISKKVGSAEDEGEGMVVGFLSNRVVALRSFDVGFFPFLSAVSVVFGFSRLLFGLTKGLVLSKFDRGDAILDAGIFNDRTFSSDSLSKTSSSSSAMQS